MQKVIRVASNKNQQKRWDDFVNNNGGGFGMLWQWNQTVASYFKHEFFPLLLVDEAENIIDLCPFIYDPKQKKYYSGVFCSSKGGTIYSSQNIKYFIQFIREIESCNEIAILSYHSYLLPNFLCAKHQDISTDLRCHKSFDEFIKSVTSSLRRNYKKATRNQLTISQANTPQDIDEFYDIYLRIMEKNNAKQVESKSWFEWLFNHFSSQQQVLYFIHNEEKKIIATVWAFMTQHEIYYYAGGSLTEFASLQSGPFMLLSLYQKALEESISAVNLGPVNLNTNRYQFKKKFNGTIKNTYHYQWYRNPVKRFSKKVFYIIRDYILSHPKLYEQIKKVIRT